MLNHLQLTVFLAPYHSLSGQVLSWRPGNKLLQRYFYSRNRR